MAKNLQKALQDNFGHSSFMAGQQETLEAIIGGHDTVAIMPTGAGKSLIYQLASQLLPGLTIVVSPLIALMQDQIDGLDTDRFRAAALTSHLSKKQVTDIQSSIANGALKLVYVTPERFDNDTFMAALKGSTVSLFVIDEAHCISEWGHDFRKAYCSLSSVIQSVGRPPVLALTATASPWVQNDIVTQLHMDKPERIVRGIDRPELFYMVEEVDDEAQDFDVLQKILYGNLTQYPTKVSNRLVNILQGQGIIYTATTEKAEETAAWLRKNGLRADHYHGQQPKMAREAAQQSFMDGDIDVIVATNAFGMGVDKPDIRWVIHRDIPGSLEEYAQEAGRAGRDGKPALCILIYRAGDLSEAAFKQGTSDARRKQYEQGRIEAVRGYATTDGCRRKYLLNYFTQSYESDQCANCDNDVTGSIGTADRSKSFFMTGDSVKHTEWGMGIVQSSDDDTTSVLFQSVGSKRLSTQLVRHQSLLRKA